MWSSSSEFRSCKWFQAMARGRILSCPYRLWFVDAVEGYQHSEHGLVWSRLGRSHFGQFA